MGKAKMFFTEKRIILLIALVAISILLLPSYKKGGAEISFVFKDSPFYGKVAEGDIIKSINSVQINVVDDYTTAISKIQQNQTVKIETQHGTFPTQIGNTTYIGLNVKRVSPTRLRLGLELQGGARVTVLPKTAEGVNLSEQLYTTTAAVLTKRLDAYGLSGVVPKRIEDFQGNKYIVVEMAGEGSERLVDLVKSIGKFELNVLNETIFGGEVIIPPIGEPARNSRSGAWQVGLNIREQAANDLRDSYLRLAPSQSGSCTQDEQCGEQFACSLPEIGIGAGQCIPKIAMLLDGKEEFSAPPAQSLFQSWKQGETTSNLVIQTRTFEDAKRVKVVLEAGRLPSEIESMEIISQDYVDPKLGRSFFRSAGIAGVFAIILVGGVIFARYRRLKIAIPIIFTGTSEIVLLLGVAALLSNSWVIDLPAIAGIIASVGMGVEQQIIITDELLSGSLRDSWDLRRRTKTAFGIILVALATVVAAMFPLLFENFFPGLFALKGFAISTILGFLIGYFITRPAYAKMAEILLLEEQAPTSS
ncbi:TPA: hypothetical protein H1005_00750 [archaeon]|uniref:Protein export membrane protein SecD/SecF C-terminal domain-containing protein n=1 Tax=Candidatus Naiadarchaeum limnaeum TaxID=2756139 RepID=A0A832V504_9ARCH|nr:hypothetical protein [Candidatus Naiadarchaeales archaeon SRR2090153.bin1042]HIK00360.1 hypothetical protein [Candidatus Naiadarchaeum limnaeum]